LSYTTFAFSELRLSRETIRAGESCEASVTVTNTGPRAGKAVIQLYVRDEESTFTRPAMELKDFRKIALEPGESAGVRFQIGPDALAYPGEDLQPWVEPGTFTLLAGDGPAQLVEARLTVLPGDESIE
jgi:beta-glucosidase